MDIHSLKRDPEKVHSTLVEDNGVLLATKECIIHIPFRFTERKLARVGSEIRTIAIFAIIVDGYYAISTYNAMMQLTPSSTNIVVIDGDEYYEFGFDAGSVICPNVNLIRENTLTYRIYDEIVAKGHVPWYFTYEDLGKIFITAPVAAGVSLSSSNVILEMMAASISRNPKDRTKFYRHYITKLSEQLTDPPAFIPFRSVIYGATNTTAKLLGAYFDDGLTSALVNPSERVEGVESLLRS